MLMLKLIVIVVALGLAALIGLGLGFDKERRQIKAIPWCVAFVIAILGFVIPQGFGQIETGYRGVVLQMGSMNGEIKNEGFYMIMPMVQTVEVMPINIQTVVVSESASSHDMQEVSTGISLNYRIKEGSVGTIYSEFRRKYEENFVQKMMKESIKAATAQYAAEALITKRSEVRQVIVADLSKRLSTQGFEVVELAITDFLFSDTFKHAIEAKQVAEQKAKQAAHDLDRVKKEAEQAVTRAEAEAKALALQKESVTAELVSLRQIEAQMKAVDSLREVFLTSQKWDGALPKVIMIGGGTAMPMVDMTQAMQ